MALSGEVGELTEIFQWQNEEESKNFSDKDLQSTKEEIVDIFIYLLRISDKLGIKILHRLMSRQKPSSANSSLYKH